MSKYIRIQDGRIIDIQKLLDKAKKDEINLTDDERKIIDCIQTDNYNCMGWKRRVFKQADTIEELCDEVVVEWYNDFETPYVHFIDTKKSLKDIAIECLENMDMEGDFEENVKNIYTAIWTEWGLKYVAKMNKEGELCLL